MSTLRLGKTWRFVSKVWRPGVCSKWHSSRALWVNSGRSHIAHYSLTRSLVGSQHHAGPGDIQPLTPLLAGRRNVSTSNAWRDEVMTVSAPQFAESVSEGDIRWEKGVGDSVEEDEVIAEIETDKTALQVPAPVSGVLEELLVADGNTVTAGMELARIRVSGTVEPKTAESAPKVPAEAPPISSPIPSIPPPPPPLPGQPLATSPPPPSPPHTSPSHTSPPHTSQSGVVVPGTREERRVKMNRMRQRIAERLKEAQNTNAMLTTFNEVDMSNVIEMRHEWKEAFQGKHGVKLGFMSPFVKAACHALQNQPIVNAVIDGTDILYRDYIDISVAVATPKGLVVPVLRNVETMNYADIEKTTAQLGEKAREGTLAIEEMDGGTFTISNGGVFGSLFGTPIINPPQSAILGMHATVDRPVAVQGKVEVRPMMYVALTYDHRLIDGREAVLFLKKIKQTVEDPRTLLLDL